jgi:ABC-2 type transport system ATP-binding protein
VSSHILAEIESTCDRVAILSGGRCVAQGTVDEVVSAAGHRPSVVVKVADLDAGERELCAAGLDVEQVDDELRVDVSSESAGEVTRILARADHWVTEMRPGRFSLEDVFLDLTAGAVADDREHIVAPATARIEEVVA